MPESTSIVPMFPLPNFFLFPGVAVPLHIFEDRYRQMVEDLLDGPGRLVMAAIQESQATDLEGTPDVFPVGGLGEIVQHRRLPDGRFLLLLAGLARVELTEVESDRPYRQVAIRIRTDLDENVDRPDLANRLRSAIQTRVSISLDLPDNLGIGELADLLLHQLPIEQSSMQDVFANRSAIGRAERALARHLASSG